MGFTTILERQYFNKQDLKRLKNAYNSTDMCVSNPDNLTGILI